MRFLWVIGRVLGAACGLLTPAMALAQAEICLLEPIGGVRCISTEGQQGFGVFFAYFNLLYPWVVGLGAAVAVMMGLIGGIEIMWAGGNDGARQAGVKRLLVSIGGLLLLLFASTILNILNPSFFK
jgi:hypothetical protein